MDVENGNSNLSHNDGATNEAFDDTSPNTKILLNFIYARSIQIVADKTKTMVMSREQTAGLSHTRMLIIVPLKGWKSSNIWERR